MTDIVSSNLGETAHVMPPIHCRHNETPKRLATLSHVTPSPTTYTNAALVEVPHHVCVVKLAAGSFRKWPSMPLHRCHWSARMPRE